MTPKFPRAEKSRARFLRHAISTTIMVEPNNSLISPRELPCGDLLAIEPPELLFHYTTIGGSYGILTSDALWMTKIRYLNDTSELEIGIATLRDLLDETLRGGPPADEAALLEQVMDGLDSFAGSNICVASFCEHGDLLSQWRWYGEGGRGVSLGVSSQVLRGMARSAINLWKCIYDESAHRELLLALLDRLLQVYRETSHGNGGQLDVAAARGLVDRFSVSFLQIAPIIKNPRFAEEREWRLVSFPVDPEDDAYGVCVVGDRIMQRYELRFPRDEDGWCRAIGRVVIGPTKDPQLIGEALALLCRKHRFECPTVAYSEIPFRST